MSRRKKKLTIADIKRNNNTTVPSVISRMKAKELELTVFFVIVILSIVITSSYIIFSSVRTKKVYNTLKTGSIEVVFNETNTSMGDIINIINKKPIIDKEAKKLEPYTFTIKNTSTKSKEYTVTIIEDKVMIEADKCSNKLYNIEDIKYSIDNKNIKTLTKKNKDIVIYKEKLKGNETKEHKLRVWISSDIKDNKKIENKHFHGKIIITAEDAKKDEIIS